MKKEHELQDWKEGRRLRAWELSQQGWKQKEIAATLGVSKGAVSQWLSRAKTEGIEGLRRHPAPGPQPKLRCTGYLDHLFRKLALRKLLGWAFWVFESTTLFFEKNFFQR